MISFGITEEEVVAYTRGWSLLSGMCVRKSNRLMGASKRAAGSQHEKLRFTV